MGMTLLMCARCWLIKNDDRRPFEQAEWIAKDFLHKMSRAVPVRIFDLDATPGNNLKEDEAGALLLAHRFDYNSEVIDFYIYHDNVTIYIKRQ